MGTAVPVQFFWLVSCFLFSRIFFFFSPFASRHSAIVSSFIMLLSGQNKKQGPALLSFPLVSLLSSSNHRDLKNKDDDEDRKTAKTKNTTKPRNVPRERKMTEGYNNKATLVSKCVTQPHVS